jgi:hypothetical protein
MNNNIGEYSIKLDKLNNIISCENYIKLLYVLSIEKGIYHDFKLKLIQNNSKTVDIDYIKIEGDLVEFINNKNIYMFVNYHLNCILSRIDDYTYYLHNEYKERIFYKCKYTHVDNDEDIYGIHGKRENKIYKTKWGYKEGNKEVLFCIRTFNFKTKEFTNVYYVENLKITQILNSLRKEKESKIEKIGFYERLKNKRNTMLNISRICEIVNTPLPLFFNKGYNLYKKLRTFDLFDYHLQNEIFGYLE